MENLIADPQHSLVMLPPELWLEIFEWAADNDNLACGSSKPFEPIPGTTQDPGLQVRLALFSVCKTWQRWMARILYKDIKIGRDTYSLQQTLGKHEQSGPRYGEMVRRVVLPYQSTVAGPSRSLKSIGILKLCPNLHTLVRPQRSFLDRMQFDYEAEAIELPRLERLHWWHHNEAERSGGINSLGVVLRGAPNLRYLFIGGAVATSQIRMEAEQMVLSKLELLRLHIKSGLLLRQILSRWSLPSLTHLTLDSPPVRDGLNAIWETFGQQLEVVEYGRHVHFLMNDDLSPCLEGCPNLKELDYHVFFTLPADSSQSHANLSVVGLHSHANVLLSDGGSLWKLIEHHFEMLCGPGLSALQRIVLYGSWRSILNHPRFRPIQKKLNGSGRILQLA